MERFLFAVHTSVVEGQIEAAELLQGVADQRLHVRLVGDIGAEEPRSPAQGRDFIHDRLALVAVAIADHHRRAGAGQRQGRRPTNARAAARHDCDLVCEAHEEPPIEDTTAHLVALHTLALADNHRYNHPRRRQSPTWDAMKPICLTLLGIVVLAGCGRQGGQGGSGSNQGGLVDRLHPLLMDPLGPPRPVQSRDCSFSAASAAMPWKPSATRPSPRRK